MKPSLLNTVGKPTLIRFCFVAYSLLTSYSQHLSFGRRKSKVEIGFNFGPTFFLGDLGGHEGKGTHFLKDLNFPLTKMMKGAFIAVYPNDWLGIRVSRAIYLCGRKG